VNSSIFLLLQAIHARAYFEDPPVPTPGPLALQQPRQQVLLAAGAKGSPAPNQLALQPYKGLQTEGSGATPLVQFRFYARYIITCLMAARKEVSTHAAGACVLINTARLQAVGRCSIHTITLPLEGWQPASSPLT
jgi:hypothetical protein